MSRESTFRVSCILAPNPADPRTGKILKAVPVVGNVSLKHFNDVSYPFESRVFKVLSSHASIQSASIRPILFPRILSRVPCTNGKCSQYIIHSTFQLCERFLWFEQERACVDTIFRHRMSVATKLLAESREEAASKEHNSTTRVGNSEEVVPKNNEDGRVVAASPRRRPRTHSYSIGSTSKPRGSGQSPNPRARTAAERAAGHNEDNGRGDYLRSHKDQQAGRRRLYASSGRCVTRPSFNEKGNRVQASVWVMGNACLQGADVLQHCARDKDIMSQIMSCVGTGTVRAVRKLDQETCSSVFGRSSLKSQVVIRSTRQTHAIGYFEEVVQFLMPLFATLLEAFREAPGQWASLVPRGPGGRNSGGDTLGGGNRSEGDLLDKGVDGLQLLWPHRTTHSLVTDLGPKAVLHNGTDEYHIIQKELFGVPTRGTSRWWFIHSCW